MAYTAGFSVSVGDPTKASDVTTLAANDDYLKAAVDGKAALSGSTNNTVATVTGANALIGEADLTFASNKLTVFGTTGTGTATAGVLNLSTRELTVVDADQLGRIEFQAPAETGSDAVLVAASIYAEADGTFSATVNATDLVLATAHDGAAAERVRITSQGEIGLAGANYGTDGQVMTSAGPNAAVAWEAIPAGVSLSGSTNNTVATVTGANALIGETGLTFNGTQLGIGGTPTRGGPFEIQGANVYQYLDATQHVFVALDRGSTSYDSGLVFQTAATTNWRLAQLGADNLLQVWDDINEEAVMSFVQGGDVTVNTSNLVIGTSGKGIDFAATGGPASGSGTSELLDDYEEGTWSPVISDGTNNATMTGATGATYTKIGNRVLCTGFVATSSLGSVSGAVRVTGLPYANGGSAQVDYGVFTCGYAHGLDITASESVMGLVEYGTAHVLLMIWNNVEGNALMTSGEWSANGNIAFAINYKI